MTKGRRLTNPPRIRYNRSDETARKPRFEEREDEMDSILTAIFEVESEGYQAFMELRNRLIGSSYTILQGALVKKAQGALTTVDMLSSASESMDDTLKGGLIGSLVGVLGGPLGVLLGTVTGQLIGGAKDSSDVDKNATLLETVGARLTDGESALLLLTREDTEAELDGYFSRFRATVLRRDAATVQDEVERAQQLEKEMAQEARRKMHEEKSEERKQKMEYNRARFNANFESFKDKFRKTEE